MKKKKELWKSGKDNEKEEREIKKGKMIIKKKKGK